MGDQVPDTALLARLKDLRDEFSRGQEMLANLERESTELREKLLRISGAIQVLEELGVDNDEPS